MSSYPLSKEFIIEYLTRVVGNANILTEPEELRKYSSDHSFVKPRMPLCVVKPGSIDEIQEIVKFANTYRIPLTPLSSGTNNLGGCIPSPNGIIIDLRRMNRIVSMDTRAGMALIEPGVTFEQLQNEVLKHGLRVLTPVELPKFSSVISTYLDLAPLYGWVYYGEENLTTMTIVLPTGEVIKTGQAAFPQIKWPYVGSHASPFAGLANYIWFQSQGTLGIVTEGWVKLKPRGEVEKAFFVPVDKTEDIYKIVRAIMWTRYPRDMVILNKFETALMFTEESPSYSEKVKETLEVAPNWTIAFILRHRKDAVEVMEEDLKDIAVKNGFKLLDEIPNVEKSPEKLIEEVRYPSGWPKWSKFKGARTILPFIASLKDLPTIHNVATKIAELYKYDTKNLGFTIIPTDRIGVVAVNISISRNMYDDEESSRLKKMYVELADALVKVGAFYSRPYGVLAKIMYSRTQNYYEVLMKLRRTIDPNNIMNPGRLNIAEEMI
ncbi:MAG: FAD-binding oxidoreductase [Ignisphaera sp.]